MKIGDLASQAQCSVETIRYYEKERLLPEPERNANNYRSYSLEHLQRLVLIRNCRAFDMSHEEIRSLLRLMDGAPDNCDSVNDLVDRHISHVEIRIQELKRLKEQLLDLRNKCRSQNTLDDCRILRGLLTMQTANQPSRVTHL